MPRATRTNRKRTSKATARRRTSRRGRTAKTGARSSHRTRRSSTTRTWGQKGFSW